MRNVINNEVKGLTINCRHFQSFSHGVCWVAWQHDSSLFCQISISIQCFVSLLKNEEKIILLRTSARLLEESDLLGNIVTLMRLESPIMFQKLTVKVSNGKMQSPTHGELALKSEVKSMLFCSSLYQRNYILWNYSLQTVNQVFFVQFFGTEFVKKGQIHRRASGFCIMTMLLTFRSTDFGPRHSYHSQNILHHLLISPYVISFTPEIGLQKV